MSFHRGLLFVQLSILLCCKQLPVCLLMRKLFFSAIPILRLPFLYHLSCNYSCATNGLPLYFVSCKQLNIWGKKKYLTKPYGMPINLGMFIPVIHMNRVRLTIFVSLSLRMTILWDNFRALVHFAVIRVSEWMTDARNVMCWLCCAGESPNCASSVDYIGNHAFISETVCFCYGKA
jgi:hypothetical protein